MRVSRKSFAAGGSALLPLLAAGWSCIASAGPLIDAIRASRPLLDARLRFEHVEQAPLAENADALTLRTRLGIETGKAWSTALLVEGEATIALTDDYNSTTNGFTQFPVVADPENAELNRLQLVNTALDATPELVNDDPYGGGWLFEVVPVAGSAGETLLDAAQYQASLQG